MYVAPIIHTRLYNCDFIPGFAVKPNSWESKETNWAKKYVLSSTEEMDSVQNKLRWIIIDDSSNKCRIAGVTGLLKTIVQNCNLSENEQKISSEVLFDNKKRPVYAFIGVVIDKQKTREYETITIEDLWRIYLKEIYPVWKKTSLETLIVPFAEKGFHKVNSASSISGTIRKVGKRSFYEANPVNDGKLFDYYLCQKDENFSFCTNIINYQHAKKCEFTILTTSPYIIDRMEKDKSIPVPDETSSDNKPSQREQPGNGEKKKNPLATESGAPQELPSNSKTLMLLLIIFVGITVVLLFLILRVMIVSATVLLAEIPVLFWACPGEQ